MASVVLTTAASALTETSSLWVQTLAIGVAGIAGGIIDRMLFSPGPIKQEGPRLSNLQVQASTEGAPIPEVAGRMRLAGQIIWATNFKEVATTETQGGKGFGSSQTVETTSYSYFANFAVGLCEGVIDRIGRIWADGQPLDLSGVTMRLYRGTDDQEPDSLIQGIEGADNTPAYRGTAYVVFENFAIANFGNRIPQLNFEVYRRVSPDDGTGIEDLVQAVTIIPGAGERVYDTTIQSRNLRGGATTPENSFAGKSVPDWDASMEDLKASLPNVGTAVLVVGWFGGDLRCASCTVKPKVEVTNKITTPDAWEVHGIVRGYADVVSQVDGRPAYGGTPSDDSVVRAVRDLKARGYSVVFYPFLFMDIASGNTLDDPWTGASTQPPYPWRGRITCDPAPGQSGTVDKTSTAGTQVADFFGTVAAGDISVSVNASTSAVTTVYSGPDEWTFRRFILHYAKLCAAINSVSAGAVDAFIIGSELRGLCQVRDSATHFPAVDALADLAGDVKGIVGSVKVGYAADWSDYGRYQPDDGSGDLFFHLDPLWASSSVDFVGVDVYVPLSDWRDGNTHLDAVAGAASIYDRDYLQSNIEGGEDFDWFYASDADRETQTRTNITDGVYSKPWVYRAKDFRNWWLNDHYDRPGGVENASATDWTPQSKPIWFTEFGIPSVDRGTNQPNVFYDPKSSESAFPYFSRGTRDDLIQRRGIEAMLTYWTGATNPTSTVYGGPMIGMIAVWTWDARPYPAWPSRTDIWSDGVLWPLGHWLNGKIGLADLAALVKERCARVGFDAIDVTGLSGIVTGYVRDRPLSPRSECETLMQAYAFDAVESEGLIKFVPRGRASVATFDASNCVLPDNGETISLVRGQETDLPDIVSVNFIDGSNDYQSGSISASRIAGYSDRKTDASFAIVMDSTQAQSIADRGLAEAWVGRETVKFGLPPSKIAYDCTDVLTLTIGGRPRDVRVTHIADMGARNIEAQRVEAAVYAPPLPGIAPPTFKPPPVYGRAALAIMDLPLLVSTDRGEAPYAAVWSSPFAGVTVMDSPTGDAYSFDTSLPVLATIGETLTDFYSGPTAYFDRVNTLRVQLYSGALESVTEEALLSGNANAFAIQNADGEWEVVQFANAELVDTGTYDLSVLLRGRLGTEHAMRAPVATGAQMVFLNAAVRQLDVQLAERGVSRFYKWGPSPTGVDDNSWQQGTYTAVCEGLKPWSPVHVKGARNSGGDLSISWKRRTRFGGVWADGTDVPLNEESERYEIDILDGGDVVRTLAATSPSVSYSAADQVTDFGSAQSSLSVTVYQLSASVGRGHGASATL